MRAIDFFSGAGGVTCGFSMAGIDVLAGLDIERKCEQTYTQNNHRLDNGEIAFICENIASLQEEELMARIPGLRRNDDEMVFVGCSPCQYYTNMSTDKTKSEKTKTLLEDFRRFVDFYRPGYIFIENVPGLQKNPESPLGRFKCFLKANHYIFDDKVLNAKYFNVPQNRRRYVLIATRIFNGNQHPFKLPKEDRGNLKTVREAIGNYDIFPPIPSGHIDETGFQHSSAMLSDVNRRRIEMVPHNGGSRIAWSDNDALQLDCYRHHDGHTDVYGRMFWDKPSPTITTRFLSISNGRYGHPEQNRAISLREGAILQSFPSDYHFYGNNMGVMARMIGNAVPPQLARAIARTIIEYNNLHINNR